MISIRHTIRIVGSIGLLLLIFSCSSYNSIDNFYNTHKDDNQVLAIRVPQVMLNLISGISPEMQGIVGNTKDIRFMRFTGLSPSRSQFLNNQMNAITTNSFIEVYRKNEDLKSNVISIREKRNTVKEILIYNTDNLSASFLYFNGDFDPAKVRNLAKNDQFKNVNEGLLKQFNANPISE